MNNKLVNTALVVYIITNTISIISAVCMAVFYYRIMS